MRSMPFGEVLEAVEGLSTEDQEQLLAVLGRRLASRRRVEIAADARETRREFAEGKCRPATPDEIIDEIVS